MKKNQRNKEISTYMDSVLLKTASKMPRILQSISKTILVELYQEGFELVNTDEVYQHVLHNSLTQDRKIGDMYYDLLFNDKYKIPTIAKTLRISKTKLYNLAKRPWNYIPIEKLLAIMNLQQDYSILKYVAKECGFILVTIGSDKKEPISYKELKRFVDEQKSSIG